MVLCKRKEVALWFVMIRTVLLLNKLIVMQIAMPPKSLKFYALDDFILSHFVTKNGLLTLLFLKCGTFALSIILIIDMFMVFCLGCVIFL